MKRDNPLTGGGTLLLILGAAAFFLPFLGRELIILSWLGKMEQPVGLSAMVVGGVLIAMGKLREVRNASPVVSPTDQVGPRPNEVSTPAPRADAQAPGPDAAPRPESGTTPPG